MSICVDWALYSWIASPFLSSRASMNTAYATHSCSEASQSSHLAFHGGLLSLFQGDSPFAFSPLLLSLLSHNCIFLPSPLEIALTSGLVKNLVFLPTVLSTFNASVNRCVDFFFPHTDPYSDTSWHWKYCQIPQAKGSVPWGYPPLQMPTASSRSSGHHNFYWTWLQIGGSHDSVSGSIIYENGS